MKAYYNEIDPYAVRWLRNLITAGLIAPGDVDDRPIQEVKPNDLKGYTQCHFFAGIAGWGYALRLAGWPDARPVWTGSCPCQPFSSAGKKQAASDERHLWPAFFDLISECRPSTIFGEQVAGKLGLEWITAVRLDLESLGYACGAADLPAGGVGAPHKRQRLFWVGNAERNPPRREDGGKHVGKPEKKGQGPQKNKNIPSGLSGPGTPLADPEGNKQREQTDSRPKRKSRHGPRHSPVADGHSNGTGSDPRKGQGKKKEIVETDRDSPRAKSAPGRRRALVSGENDLGNPDQKGLPGRSAPGGRPGQQSAWAGMSFVPCSDGKARPIKPGILPLADGIPGRVGQIRAYGNAIVPQVAAVFIRSFMEV